MERIKSVLINEYGFNIDDKYEKWYMYAHNDFVLAVIVSPHSGTKYRWMVRFSTISAFDRWANSIAIEEFFESKEDVEKYLRENKTQIYAELLKYLSREYEELWETHIGQED